MLYHFLQSQYDKSCHGISPKQFAQFVRFQSLLEQIDEREEIMVFHGGADALVRSVTAPVFIYEGSSSSEGE